ncbi:MAG: HD domain-containing protein, partial [Clostridia bacterium]|nr:HD domain-containing protein [Clostridia bacterium]
MDIRQIDNPEIREYCKELFDALANYTDEERKNIEDAFDFAWHAHSEISQVRKSGEPYIIHPLAVAKILVGFGMDAPSVQAALMHDVAEDTPYSIDDISRRFGSEVAFLVDGVTKMGHVPLKGKEEQQAENLRKLLLAMSNDIRVIIIKLADRLHNMRTLSFVKAKKRRETARETLEIYAPIAHRLGIRAMKEELEDLAIGYLDPVAYENISCRLSELEPKQKDFLKRIVFAMSERVMPVCSGARIDSRIKSVHGIFKKMYMQGKLFEEIYDIYAVRIIVDTVPQCYNCLGIIHDMYTPLGGRFKDYISTPKSNNYQSLHT